MWIEDANLTYRGYLCLAEGVACQYSYEEEAEMNAQRSNNFEYKAVLFATNACVLKGWTILSISMQMTSHHVGIELRLGA